MNSSAYLSHIESWSKKRYDDLIKDGSIVFSTILKQGTFTIGSDETNDICIRQSPSCPDFIGSFTVMDKVIQFQIIPPFGKSDQPLDNQGSMGMIVYITPLLSILVSPPREDGEILIAVKDVHSWTVQSLLATLQDKKNKTFPVNTEDYIVSGILQGQLVTFRLFGKEYSMKVERLFEDKFLLYFGDATNGSETFVNGRLVEGYIIKSQIASPKQDAINHESSRQIYMDFNTCYHRSCALSVHFDCPSVSTQNTLDIRVEAGEVLPF